MAPEQARGQRDVTSAADVYALGGLVFRSIAGRNVFDAEDALRLLLQIVTVDAPRLAEVIDVPAALDELVAAMLSRPPAARPTAVDVAARLRAIAASAITPARADEDAPAPKSVARPALTGDELSFRWLAVARLAQPVGLRLAGLQVSAQRVGARLELLADGSLLMLAEGRGAPTELASAVARAALAVRAVLPRASIALFGSRTLSGTRTAPSAEPIVFPDTAIDDGIAVDADVAALLADRFALQARRGRPLARRRDVVAVRPHAPRSPRAVRRPRARAPQRLRRRSSTRARATASRARWSSRARPASARVGYATCSSSASARARPPPRSGSAAAIR